MKNDRLKENCLRSSMKGVGFSEVEVKEVYTSIKQITTANKLTVGKSNRVMSTLSHIVSTGTVNSEELLRQLGDILPSTMKATASVTGKTYEEIVEMLKCGELISKDFLLPFVRVQRSMVSRN